MLRGRLRGGDDRRGPEKWLKLTVMSLTKAIADAERFHGDVLGRAVGRSGDPGNLETFAS